MDGLIALALAKNFTTESVQALGNVMNFKGVKATVADLPSTGNKAGDVWAVTAEGTEYVWTTASAWEKLGYNTQQAQSIAYTTTAPTEANPDGIKIVVLSSEPATKYNGWLYLITEA